MIVFFFPSSGMVSNPDSPKRKPHLRARLTSTCLDDQITDADFLATR